MTFSPSPINRRVAALLLYYNYSNFLLGINKNHQNPFVLFVCSAQVLSVLSPLQVNEFPDRVESPPNQPSAFEQHKSKNTASLKNK